LKAKAFKIKSIGLDLDRDLLEKARKAASFESISNITEFREEDIMKSDYLLKTWFDSTRYI
jgi:hypothetical protein